MAKVYTEEELNNFSRETLMAVMADTCIRRGKHTNYGSIFY